MLRDKLALDITKAAVGRAGTIVLFAVAQLVVILITHGECTLKEPEVIEDANAEQTVTLYDNRGNYAELIAYHDIDGTLVLSINATDGVVASTIALALVNFATGLVTDNATARYLDYAKARLMDTCVELMGLTQNEQPVNQDDCPF